MSKSDRRWFLKMLPTAAMGAVAIATAPASLQVLQVEELKTLPLSDEELTAIGNASAICFGLKPRTMRDKYTDISKLGA